MAIVCCVCLTYTDGAYYFQSSESCGCVSMFMHSPMLCRYSSGVSGFSWGFPLRLPLRLV